MDFARVFREKKGFDIVIGNPPYLKEIDYKEIFEVVNKTIFGNTYSEGKMNFWYYFFHKGLDLLHDNGSLSFIAPNYFVAGAGATKLNRRLVNDCSIHKYIDFNKAKVFESADVQCMVMIISKGNTTSKPFDAYFFDKNVVRDEIASIILNLNTSDRVRHIVIESQKTIMLPDNKINFENAEFGAILEKIEKHIQNVKLFKSTQGVVENPSFLNKKNIAALGARGYDISAYLPGDPVFVIPREKIDKLHLMEDEKKILREYHEPNEIHRYYCSNDFHNYLLYLSKETVPDIDAFPNLKAHLERFKPFMEQRRETQAGSVPWFQLHWPRKEELFINEKIVYPQMGAIPTFAYTDKSFFVNMSANIVYAIKQINLKVMTCVLNSTLAHFWLLHRAKNRGIGLDIAVSVIDKFPVDEYILSNQHLKEIATEIISKAQSGESYSTLEDSFNTELFKLYQITPLEIETIRKYISTRTNEKDGRSNDK